MSQPQPCAHVFSLCYVCDHCGRTAEDAVDMPELFGACWRHVPYGYELYRRDEESIGVRKASA